MGSSAQGRTRLRRYGAAVAVIGFLWRAIDFLSSADWLVTRSRDFAAALARVSFPSVSTTLTILGALIFLLAVVLDRKATKKSSSGGAHLVSEPQIAETSGSPPSSIQDGLDDGKVPILPRPGVSPETDQPEIEGPVAPVGPNAGQDDLRQRALRFAEDIRAFIRERRIRRPRLDSPLGRVVGLFERGEEISRYDNATAVLFDERFGDRVKRIGKDLQGYLPYGTDDLDELQTDPLPADEDEMGEVASRIAGLARMVPSAVWEAEHSETLDADGHVLLTLRRLDGDTIPDGTGCIVRGPEGEHKASWDALRFGGEVMTLRYPRDFIDARSAVGRGSYEALWLGTEFTRGTEGARAKGKHYELVSDGFEVQAGGRIS